MAVLHLSLGSLSIHLNYPTACKFPWDPYSTR